METAFELLINKFLDQRIGIVEDFIDIELSNQLRNNIVELLAQKELEQAGIGNLYNYTQDKSIRKDLIYWLDKTHENIHEKAFLMLIDNFVAHLNKTCFAGIVSSEFHYAYYDKDSFYKKHLDQFKLDDKRAFTMILYLNENWQTGDGGELCVYFEKEKVLVAPTQAKCVFFKSNDLVHEVLLNNKPRYSITGWLKTN